MNKRSGKKGKRREMNVEEGRKEGIVENTRKLKKRENGKTHEKKKKKKKNYWGNKEEICTRGRCEARDESKVRRKKE